MVFVIKLLHQNLIEYGIMILYRNMCWLCEQNWHTKRGNNVFLYASNFIIGARLEKQEVRPQNIVHKNKRRGEIMQRTRKTLSIFLVLALVISQTFSVFAISFKDVTNHWSKSYVEDMANKNVIKGYEDGTFKPENPVTKVQAVIMMLRAKGTPATDLYNAGLRHKSLMDKNRIPTWALNYVAYAYDQKILTESDVATMMQGSMEAPLSREEFCVYIIKALGLEEEVKKAVVYSLPFVDKSTISIATAPYVYFAYQRGIISGTDNNYFLPKNVVTRAAAAKMLSVSYKLFNGGTGTTPGIIPGQTFAVKGSISAVLGTGNSKYIYVKLDNGVTVLYATTPTTVIKREGIPSNASEIKEGKACELIVDSAKKILSIDLKDVAEKFTGEIVRVATDYQSLVIKVGNEERTYRVSNSAKITSNGKSVQVKNLYVGDSGEFEAKNFEITSAKLASRENYVQGEIYYLRTTRDELTLKLSSSKREDYRYEDRDVSIYVDGRSERESDLKEGYQAELVLEKAGSSYVSKIYAFSKDRYSGKIKKLVAGTKPRITIEDRTYNREITFTVAENAKIDASSKRYFSDLKEGDNVELSLKYGLVERISSGTASYDYTVYKVDYTGDMHLTVKDYRGRTKEYEVLDDVEVEIDGRKDRFRYLKEGYGVSFDLDSRDRIKYIRASSKKSGQVTKGTVYNVDTIGTWGITIKDRYGDKYKYEVDKYVKVKIDGNRYKDFDDIKEDYEVELTLDRNDVVTDIEATSTYSNKEEEGTITDVDYSGTWYIEIESRYGRKEKFRVDPDVRVKIDRRRAAFDDLKKGYSAKLYLDRNGRVIEIEANSENANKTVKGTVVEVDAHGYFKITIEDRYGKETKYDVDDDVSVEIDGRKRSFSYLEKGYEVKLYLTYSDKVIKIEAESRQTKISGTIKDVDLTGKWHIDLEDNKGKVETYLVDDGVDVRIDGRRADFRDLKKGYKAEIHLRSDVVVEIDADKVELTSTSGYVADIDKSGSLGISIIRRADDDPSDAKDYDVDRNVTVIIEGRSADFDDIEIGYKVEIFYDENSKEVYRIEAEKRGSQIYGKIVSIDHSDYAFTIETKAGKEHDWDLSSSQVKNIVIDVNGGNDFDDMEKGDYITVYLDDDGNVVAIRD